MRSRDNDVRVEKVVDRIVEIMGQFNGRNITEFLDAYKREMIQRNIYEARQISSFKRVVANNVQRWVIELQEGKTKWFEFDNGPSPRREDNVVRVRNRGFVEDDATCLD